MLSYVYRNTRSGHLEGGQPMQHIDYLKDRIIEQIMNTADADLLDFILKLLIAEG